MATDIYQCADMAVAVAAVYCSRCHRREVCVHIVAPPNFADSLTRGMNLCLSRCWLELCAAVRERRPVQEETHGLDGEDS